MNNKKQSMTGKYLITTDNWFIAPDGQQYQSIWGEIEILEDSILGIKTNSRSSNWYIKIGTEKNHVIVAGCQIHYACKSENKPSKQGCLSWNLTGTDYKEKKVPSKIYFTE